jgi:hypothetical protein
MKITKIGYGFTKSLGNYENCRLHLEAELEDGEDVEAALDTLRDRVTKELDLPDQWHDLKGKFARQLAALDALYKRTEEQQTLLHKAEEAWENFAEFLVGHGVDPTTLTVKNFVATKADHLPAPNNDQEPSNFLDSDEDEDEDNDPYWDDSYLADKVKQNLQRKNHSIALPF